jgi:phage terminase large subunit-like protein
MRYDINHTWVCRNSKDLKDGRIKAPLKEWEDMGLLTFVDDVEIAPTLLTEYIRKASEKYFIMGIGLDSFRYALMREALFDIGFDPKERGNVRLIRPSDIMRVQPVIESCFVNRYFAWDNHPLMRWAANNTKLVRQGKKEGTDTGNFYYAKIEAKSRKTDPFMAMVAAMVLEDNLPNAEYADIPDLGVIIG